MTSPGEGVTVFTSPYLSVGAPAPGEAKGLIELEIKRKEAEERKFKIKIIKIFKRLKAKLLLLGYSS